MSFESDNIKHNLQIEELSKKLYGLHQLSLVTHRGSNDANTTKAMQNKIAEILMKLKKIGAEISTREDMLAKYPLVINLNGEEVNYDIGKLEVEKINNFFPYRLAMFIEHY